ncbi:MAG: hypothetical protein H7Y09_07905 [Chitinophagaceae bacterium]|nr:hypothetical protein [Anaerolineae bacterium]
MSDINVKDAIIRLYDDSSLTDELTDEPAKVLLKWAETQLPKLAERYYEEETFEDAFKTLRGLMKGMGRLTGQRETMLPEEQQEALQKMFDRSTQLDYKATADLTDVYLEKQTILSEQDHVNALIAWLETGTLEIQPLTPPNSPDVLGNSILTASHLTSNAPQQEQILTHGEENL